MKRCLNRNLMYLDARFYSFKVTVITLQRCNIETKTSRNAGRVCYIAFLCSRSRMHYFDLVVTECYERFDHDHFSASFNFSFNSDAISVCVCDAGQSDGAILL